MSEKYTYLVLFLVTEEVENLFLITVFEICKVCEGIILHNICFDLKSRMMDPGCIVLEEN